MGEIKLVGKAFGDEIISRLVETAEQDCSVSFDQEGASDVVATV